MKQALFYGLFVAACCSGCTRESFTNSPDARIRFSVNRLDFDTVFTSTGSITKQFKIFNDNEHRILLSDISLKGGTGSYYHFNADGRSGNPVSNIEIASRDSIYVFVSVKIDPSQSDLPFVIRDTLEVKLNGRSQQVALSAWGQNAFFLNSRIIAADTSWNNKLPIVITGGLLVAEGVTLDIRKGTRIYLHADAPLIIEGRLIATGDKDDSTKVIFQGDRLDNYYRDLPGSWPGIYFTEESAGSRLENVIVKGAYQGIAAEGPAVTIEEKVILDRCMIVNCYDAGLIALNSNVRVANTVIYNCGRGIMLIKGGDYNFVHCTIAAVGNAYVPHKQPAVTLTDYTRQGNEYSFGVMDATFTNCIFWGSNGSVEDEAVVSREGVEPFDVSFTSCLWKMKERPPTGSMEGIIENEDPLFSKASDGGMDFDLRLREGSPAINQGVEAGAGPDYHGRPRINTPDIGAFESTF